MKKGTLIVNSFLKTPQVIETYNSLLDAAKNHGIDMNIIGNADFFARLDNKGVENSSGTFVADLLGPAKESFVLFWNKDVFLARALEEQGYRLLNPSGGIEICDDKSLTFEKLKGCVKMPKTFKIPMTFDTVGYCDFAFEKVLGEMLGYPYVIKESYGSYGGQVYLAQDSETARIILKKIEGKECLAQEYIGFCRGRDIRAYVVGGRVASAIERCNPNDFRANIANGGSAKEYKLSAQEEEMAVKVTKELGLDFAGVDILHGEDGPVLCEVNSNAQFKGIFDATKINIADVILEYIGGLY